MKRVLLFVALVAVPPVAYHLQRKRKAEEEQNKVLFFREVLQTDIGEAHPLWIPPGLCPAEWRSSAAKPARYPGLNFCPPPLLHNLKFKLFANMNGREYNGDAREAWNAEYLDKTKIITEYWQLDSAMFMAILKNQTKLSKWLVNVGAGPSAMAQNALREPAMGDELSMLWPMGYTGLCTDLPSQETDVRLWYRRFPKAKLDFTSLTPDALVRKLHEVQAPRDIDIVKIDIDSHDCDYMEALYNDGFRPKVFVIELAASIPPPLKFKVLMEDYPVAATRFTPFQGCNLQYAVDFLRPRGYTLIQYTVEDGWFVQDEFAHLFGELYHTASEVYDLGNPFVANKWPWPEFAWSIRQLRNDTPAMLAKVEAGLKALIELRPGLEKVKYVLEAGTEP